MKQQIIIRVPKWTNDKLKEISKQKGISKNALITTMICEYIKKEERGK